MKSPTTEKFDLYQTVTNAIVEAIESGLADGNWKRPWHTVAGHAGSPINFESRKPYRGINILCLMASAAKNGFTSGEWGTYKQWAERGAQVKRGSNGTQIVFWKFDTVKGKRKADSGESGDAGGADGEVVSLRRRAVLARAYYVFNAAQVDGYTPKPETIRPEPERFQAAEEFFAGCNVDLRHGGNSAHYSPLFDHVQMPHLSQFDSAVPYYGTLAHEFTHWTGHSSRLDRDLSKRFGTLGYAAEELIAEIGAAFMCVMLGIESAPREDHAKYVKHWLDVLKGDKYAIFTASSKAQQAVDFLIARAQGEALPAIAEEGAEDAAPAVERELVGAGV